MGLGRASSVDSRRFPVGNALLGEGGSLSSIVSSAVRFCVALLSVWFACFGFIYRYHRVSQSTNWYFAKRDGYKRKNESSATWSVLIALSSYSLLFVASFRKVPFRFVSQTTVSREETTIIFLQGASIKTMGHIFENRGRTARYWNAHFVSLF